MKAENIVNGLRVKVKKSSPMRMAKGKFGTVVGKTYVRDTETYVKVVIDGVDTIDDCHTLDITSLKYSQETPVVGDRFVVRKGCKPLFQKGACGVVEWIDSDGDVFVKFDSGDYNSVDGLWFASLPRLAIIREIL